MFNLFCFLLTIHCYIPILNMVFSITKYATAFSTDWFVCLFCFFKVSGNSVFSSNQSVKYLSRLSDTRPYELLHFEWKKKKASEIVRCDRIAVFETVHKSDKKDFWTGQMINLSSATSIIIQKEWNLMKEIIFTQNIFQHHIAFCICRAIYFHRIVESHTCDTSRIIQEPPGNGARLPHSRKWNRISRMWKYKNKFYYFF